MNTPAIARWTPTGWESWFQPTEDAYKAVEYIASTCRAEKVKLNNRAERVWVEEVDELLDWVSMHGSSLRKISSQPKEQRRKTYVQIRYPVQRRYAIHCRIEI